ncbi:DUF1839 family protein [Pararhizobium mangrovi]|uniref:DUF1839 family protein n=1 Tax=Pararhizobium mangrovi TaxID=2590452 RepID=A0A506UHL7_9HYPH|nr:DUF1839 family protein [Pararhizobium mangrovi]TPW32806.1 DUF1839 family protein [Pararhizobium mangrovi]
MRHVIPGITAATYAAHRLHDLERAWPETNCYVDLLIEVLSAAGHEPAAALGFTLAQDFEGDQFTFFKFPTGDLATLYGLEIQELAIFDRLEDHIGVQIDRGRLPLVEFDAFHLPDTEGVSYRIAHTKTTVAVNAIDPVRRRMGYFHNAGYFELEGEDYAALFADRAAQTGLPLFPYSEFVKFDRTAAASDPVETSLSLLRHHAARRPAENPVGAYRAVFDAHMAALADRPPDYFHAYAFNTLRQLGANFELLQSHLAWLGENGVTGLDTAGAQAGTIANGAKTMQFKLARAMARRRFDGLGDTLDPLVTAYDRLTASLDLALSDTRSSRAA